MSGNYPSHNEANLARIVQSIRDLFAGRNNCTGQFTLAAAPATTTVVSAPNMGPDAYPFFTPITADAATEWGAGFMYVSARGQGTFTVTHSSSASTTRTFGYVALG